jgi:Holliday junction resolvasome RuvABC endonuclease subunit
MTVLKIVGLDLSITATGICAHNGATSTVGGDAKLGDRRLVKILRAVEPVILGADVVMVEDLPKSGMGSATTGMVQGVVRALLTDCGVPYILVTPSSLKTYATGNGNAPKPDLRMSLFKRFGIDLRDDNQCDAWWLRALGNDLYDQPLAQSNGRTDLPQNHRRALAKVTRVPIRMKR